MDFIENVHFVHVSTPGGAEFCLTFDDFGMISDGFERKRPFRTSKHTWRGLNFLTLDGFGKILTGF